MRRQLAQLEHENRVLRTTATLPENMKKSPRKSIGGFSVWSPHTIQLPTTSTLPEISRTESIYVQSKFIESVRIGHKQFNNVIRMMAVKKLIFVWHNTTISTGNGA